MQKKKHKTTHSEKDSKFERCTLEIQALVRKTRAAGWQKWMKFDAAAMLEPHEVGELVSQGFFILPMQ